MWLYLPQTVHTNFLVCAVPTTDSADNFLVCPVPTTDSAQYLPQTVHTNFLVCAVPTTDSAHELLGVRVGAGLGVAFAREVLAARAAREGLSIRGVVRHHVLAQVTRALKPERGTG